MSDAGTVVGTSWDWGVPADVVVWRDSGPPTEAGIGGLVRDDGSWVDGSAVDVNEAGVVAAMRTGYSADNRVRSQTAVLWDEYSGAARLPVLPHRRRARIHALNDHGVGVGSVSGARTREVPVYWADDEVMRLALPHGARSGYAVDNTNHDLIVGNVLMSRETRPWWWRRNGRNGPLSAHGLRTIPVAVAVDNHGRVVGDRHRRGYDPSTQAVLWRTHTARPRQVLGHMGGATSIHDSRHLVGYSQGFRGISSQAWVARLPNASAGLPAPPSDETGAAWSFTFALAVSNGVTAFAPQGGITAGGGAQQDEGEPTRAVLWTCSQTYLE